MRTGSLRTRPIYKYLDNLVFLLKYTFFSKMKICQARYMYKSTLNLLWKREKFPLLELRRDKKLNKKEERVKKMYRK